MTINLQRHVNGYNGGGSCPTINWYLSFLGGSTTAIMAVVLAQQSTGTKAAMAAVLARQSTNNGGGI